MKDPKVRIVVAGSTGAGKSAIAQIIAEALEAKGLKVELQVEKGSFVGWNDERFEKVLENGTKVSLEERHLYKDGMNFCASGDLSREFEYMEKHRKG